MKIPHGRTTAKPTLYWIIGTSLLVIIGSYSYYSLHTKYTKDHALLSGKIAELETVLSEKETTLLATQTENTDLGQKLNEEKEQVTSYKGQVKEITQTVKTLEKLTNTDDELLKKYSKVYFLNENYVPPKLTNIDEEYLLTKNKPLLIHSEVWPHLEDMLEAAEDNDTPLLALSAYRSFNTQAELKASYKVTYGAGTANRFSAEQGYSEHQLGTTVDLTTPTLAGLSTSFENTEAYKWLLKNASEYGFIISYPKENTHYQFEPWHWRYVGIDLAEKLQDEDKFFYNLDQREIDEYLVRIFD